MLHSGYVLYDSERDEMARILEEEEYEREQFEREIDHTRQLLEVLGQRKRELEVNISQRRSTFSALRRIPTEILENIFTRVCSSTPTGYSLTVDVSQLPALLDYPAVVLSQVCSRWRCIAHSYPELWTSMSIQLSSIFGCHRIISLFLANSRGHLLDIRVQEHADDRVTEAGGAIWAELSGHLWRCWRLTLDIADFGVLLHTDFQQLSFPNLTMYEEEVLDQSTRGWEEGPTLTENWWKALEGAPKLTDVTMCFLHTPTALPYSQLTRLKVRRMSPSEIQRLSQTLSVCRKLVYLKLGCIDNVTLTSVGYRLDPVKVPALRELVIEGCHGTLNAHSDLLSHLLRSLLLPSLDMFDLRCGGLTMYRGWPPALLDMLRRVSPTLRRLSLYISHCTLPANPHAEPTLASALLGSFPELEVLQVAMERNRHGNEAHYRAHADFFVRDICAQLGDSKPSPLPKIVSVSLFMSNISLDSSTLEIALDTAKAPSGAVADNEDDTSQVCHPKTLTKLSISRFPLPIYLRKVTGRPKLLQLAPSVKEKIRNLERGGLKVIIQDFDGFPAELVQGNK